MDINNKH